MGELEVDWAEVAKEFRRKGDMDDPRVQQTVSAVEARAAEDATVLPTPTRTQAGRRGSVGPSA